MRDRGATAWMVLDRQIEIRLRIIQRRIGYVKIQTGPTQINAGLFQVKDSTNAAIPAMKNTPSAIQYIKYNQFQLIYQNHRFMSIIILLEHLKSYLLILDFLNQTSLYSFKSEIIFLNQKMDSLANKWKALIQSQSQQQMKLSQLTHSRLDASQSKNKESAIMRLEDSHKNPKPREERQKTNKEEKSKNSRTKSNEHRKYSNSKYEKGQTVTAQTPVKELNKKQDKVIDGYTNAIIDLLEEGPSGRLRGKVRALLEDYTLNMQTQSNMNSGLKFGQGDRSYHQLEQKYLQSERERQYLKGKMQVSTKRYEGLERQIQRYSKIQKLIDTSINRQNELRQELNRLKTEKTHLQSQLDHQNQTFSRQVLSIRSLIQTLKQQLPNN